MDERLIGEMQSDIWHLKEGQAEVRGEIGDIKRNISEINVTTAEIKTLLNGKGSGAVPTKWLVLTTLILAAILAVVLGVPIPG